jgi:phage regulator Rha-like protein
MNYMTKTREYAEIAKKQIDQVATEIDKLQVKADQTITEVRTEYDRKIKELSVEFERQLQELRQKKHEADLKIDKLRTASGSAFEEVKVGADTAINDMNAALIRARKKFRSP